MPLLIPNIQTFLNMSSMFKPTYIIQVSNSSHNNNGTITLSSLTFEYASFGINSPFILMFLILTILLGGNIIVFTLQKQKVLKKNHKIMFLMLLALSFVSFINTCTRISSDMAYLATNTNTFTVVYNLLKAFDRIMTAVSIELEFLFLIFVSHVL